MSSRERDCGAFYAAIRIIVREHPDKTSQWATDQLERCLINQDGPENAETIREILVEGFGIDAPDIEEAKLMVPTLHLNGTGASELMAQHTDAMHALHQALKVMAHTTPNGRDYYPQGDNAIHRATRQYIERGNRILAVIADLEIIAEEIFAQVKK